MMIGTIIWSLSCGIDGYLSAFSASSSVLCWTDICWQWSRLKYREGVLFKKLFWDNASLVTLWTWFIMLLEMAFWLYWFLYHNWNKMHRFLSNRCFLTVAPLYLLYANMCVYCFYVNVNLIFDLKSPDIMFNYPFHNCKALRNLNLCLRNKFYLLSGLKLKQIKHWAN